MTAAASIDLLDRFATAAMPVLLSKYPLSGLPITNDEATGIAATAYRIAWAMLRQHNVIAEQVRAEAMRPAAPTT